MILDLPDLQKLSGYKRSSDVKGWLRRNGIAFLEQPSGRPVTTLDTVNRALEGPTNPSRQPDWSAIKRKPSRVTAERAQAIAKVIKKRFAK